MTAATARDADVTARHIEATQRFAAHNYDPLPVVIAEGRGAWVIDVEGRRFLDCLAGYSALNFGHCHPRLVARATHQLQRLTQALRHQHQPLVARRMPQAVIELLEIVQIEEQHRRMGALALAGLLRMA